MSNSFEVVYTMGYEEGHQHGQQDERYELRDIIKHYQHTCNESSYYTEGLEWCLALLRTRIKEGLK